MDIEIWKLLAQQVAGLIALAVVLFFIYRLSCKFGIPFIEAQNMQASAMQNQATSMQNQAVSMGEMKDCVVGYISKDNNDHSEIRLSLQVAIKEITGLGDKINSQEESIKDFGKEVNGLGEIIKRFNPDTGTGKLSGTNKEIQ
jgi:hypothetical protein